MSSPRRTQAERREATIGKLLLATVECLSELGYSGTSTAAICKRAGVSQGGLFRHFGTRLELVAAATEQIGRGNVATIEQLRAEAHAGTVDAHTLLHLARTLARSEPHAAWHEVMVAARTDPDLRRAVNPALGRYEAALHALARTLLPDAHPDPERGETLILSMLHMFDSEAVTRRVHSSPAIEDARLDWAIATLERELSPPTPSAH